MYVYMYEVQNIKIVLNKEDNAAAGTKEIQQGSITLKIHLKTPTFMIPASL